MNARRRIAGVALGAALACAGASSAGAAGAIRIDWNNCPTSPVDKAIVPGDVVTFFVTLTGESATHIGYHVYVDIVPTTGGQLPDAWRFDQDGCQGPSFLKIGHRLAPQPSDCLNFQGAAASSQQKLFLYDAVHGRAQVRLVNVYPQTPQVALPENRYFLMQVVFDHEFSVNGPGDPGATCGGLDQATCLAITSAAYHDTDDMDVPWTVERGVISANDPTGACAGSTPVRARTWGLIKSLYRG